MLKACSRVTRSGTVKRFSSSWEQVYTPPDMSKLVKGDWLLMNRDTREEIVEYLDWRMEEPWTNLSQADKQSAFYIAYGNWGPRAPKGSKEDQLAMSGPELMVKAIFSFTLFLGLGFVAVNYKKDKAVRES